MKRNHRFVAIILAVLCVLAGSVYAYARYNTPEYPMGLPVLDPNEVNYLVPSQQADKAEKNVSLVSAAKSVSPAETKDEIYDRMLNSVDYYDVAEVCFDLTDLDGLAITCQIETDLRSGQAYEAVAPLIEGYETINSDYSDIESYADGTWVTDYFNKERTYSVSRPVTVRRMSEDEIAADQPRAFIGANDNMPNYVYSADPTNTIYGSNCLFPQGITFGYLADFELWDITGHESYLDRDCLVLSGQTTGSYDKKTGVSSFTMYVDSQTGILLKLSGLNESGNVARSMTVNSISIDGPTAYSTSRHDMSKYADYTKLDS